MAAWRYGISLLVLKKCFTRSLRPLVKYFSTLEDKFCISARPCIIILYIPLQTAIKRFHSFISFFENREKKQRPDTFLLHKRPMRPRYKLSNIWLQLFKRLITLSAG